jgi:hypothetical protein
MNTKEFFVKIQKICGEHDSCVNCPLRKHVDKCVDFLRDGMNDVIDIVENYKLEEPNEDHS